MGFPNKWLSSPCNPQQQSVPQEWSSNRIGCGVWGLLLLPSPGLMLTAMLLTDHTMTPFRFFWLVQASPLWAQNQLHRWPCHHLSSENQRGREGGKLKMAPKAKGRFPVVKWWVEMTMSMSDNEKQGHNSRSWGNFFFFFWSVSRGPDCWETKTISTCLISHPPVVLWCRLPVQSHLPNLGCSRLHWSDDAPSADLVSKAVVT